jgi:hypothetical protein
MFQNLPGDLKQSIVLKHEKRKYYKTDKFDNNIGDITDISKTIKLELAPLTGIEPVPLTRQTGYHHYFNHQIQQPMSSSNELLSQ